MCIRDRRNIVRKLARDSANTKYKYPYRLTYALLVEDKKRIASDRISEPLRLADDKEAYGRWIGDSK